MEFIFDSSRFGPERGELVDSFVVCTVSPDLFRLVLWAGEFFGVGFAFAAEVDDFFAGEKGPVGDDAGGGGTLHELGVADCVGLCATNGCYESG